MWPGQAVAQTASLEPTTPLVFSPPFLLLRPGQARSSAEWSPPPSQNPLFFYSTLLLHWKLGVADLYLYTTTTTTLKQKCYAQCGFIEYLSVGLLYRVIESHICWQSVLYYNRSPPKKSISYCEVHRPKKLSVFRRFLGQRCFCCIFSPQNRSGPFSWREKWTFYGSGPQLDFVRPEK